MSPAASSSAARSGRRLMLLAAAFFVMNVLLIRAFGQAGADVWTIAALRFGAGLGLCLALHSREVDARALFTRPRLVLRGVIGGAATYGFYLTVVHLGAGRATFLNNSYVVFSSLLAVWLLAERFRLPLALGAGAALLGLGMLTGVFSAGSAGAGAGAYDAVALLVALASGWIVVSIRQLHREGVSTATIFAAQCVYGLLLSAPFLVAHASWPEPRASAWLVVGGLCAGAGQLLMTRAYRDMPVAEGALIQTLVPLGIAAGGVAFFGERLGVAELGGGLLIVAGSCLPMVLPARSAAAVRSG